MVSTRGKQVNFNVYSSDGEMDVEQPEKPAPKRRKSKKSGSADGDPGFVPSSSSAKGKDKATSDQNQLITRRSGKGGKLRDLMNMPVDIFTEVCSYLGPFDLRRLALTSKRLWDILMTKEARPIWKTALESVPDLPECPTDLNEPQYVCLMYSSECYTTVCSTSVWAARPAVPKPTGSIGFDFAQPASKPMTGSGHIDRQSSSRKLPQNQERHHYVEALKKAGHELESLSRDAALEYLSLLKEKREYRAETAIDMHSWNRHQTFSRADDIAAEKNARFESIKAKLLELGYVEEDLPMWNKEFTKLVRKDQKLTPKVWQNVKPKLELILEPRRAERLRQEKAKRTSSRRDAIDRFYRQLCRDIVELPGARSPSDYWFEQISDISALPSVKVLLEADTETVTTEQWAEVAPQVRPVVIKWWRNHLKRLVDDRDGGWTVIPNKIDWEVAGQASSEVETEEEIASSIFDLKGTLSFATFALYCKHTACRKKIVWWFPDLTCHPSHYATDTGEVSNRLWPLQPECKILLDRLLRDLVFDPETVKTSELVVNDRTRKAFLCTRCDERVAQYMNFSDLMEHYLGVQKWFDDVTDAVRTSPDTCYPSRAVNSELPKIVNSHDWIACDAPLVRRDDQEAVGILLGEGRTLVRGGEKI